jgi:hypothetical protein
VGAAAVEGGDVVVGVDGEYAAQVGVFGEEFFGFV